MTGRLLRNLDLNRISVSPRPRPMHDTRVLLRFAPAVSIADDAISSQDVKSLAQIVSER